MFLASRNSHRLVCSSTVVAVCLIGVATRHPAGVRADSVYHNLAASSFAQSWSNNGLITADDNWSGVPSVVGYRGDDVTTATGADPQTLVGSSSVIDVNANRPDPNSFATGGVTEFHLTDPTIALQGSGTADAPYIQLHLNATGRQNITVSYRLRDLESGADSAVQQVALQYRVNATDPWTNVSSAYVADATVGPNVAGADIPVSEVLPLAANDAAQLQVRIITTNASGSDEWVGVGDILVSSAPCDGPCPLPPPPVITTISEIQGEGRFSPKLNELVTTQGVVTARARNGFYLQSNLPDGKAATSEGLFVFTGSTPGVQASVGDTIKVSGWVGEFSNVGEATPTLTQLRNPFGFQTLAPGTAANLPAPVLLSTADLSPTAPFDRLERYEGMLVSVPATVVVAPSGTRGVLPDGQFHVTLPNVPAPFREAGIEAQVQLATNEPPLASPTPSTVPRFATNPEVLRVDTDELFAYEGQRTPGITAAVGASVAPFTAILHFEDRHYNALPVVSTSGEVLNLLENNFLSAVKPSPAPRGNQFTIASANLEFFSSSDTNRLAKVVRSICDVLRAPDILGVIEIDTLSSLNDIAFGLNTFGGGCTGSEYAAFLTDPDTSSQHTGFLVKVARTNGIRVTVVDTNRVNTVEGGIHPNAIFTQGDRRPYILQATVSGNGQSLPVTVILHHTKSLIGSDVPAGTGDRQKRLNHALYAASLIRRLQMEDPNVNLAVMGDLNAFEFSDGIVDVLGILRGDPVTDQETYLNGDSVDVYGTPGYSDLINLTSLAEFPLSERFSFTFRGNRQALDHIVVNRNLYERLRGYTIAHVNSLYPDFDPSTGQRLRDIATRPEGYSDHDVPMAYFALVGNGPVDISGRVRVTSSGLSYSRATGVYSGTLTLRLTGSETLNGPFTVLLTNLPPGITFVNETGVSSAGPFFVLDVPFLSATSPVNIQMQVQNSTGALPSWMPKIFAGEL
jgi:hypothetical protein